MYNYDIRYKANQIERNSGSNFTATLIFIAVLGLIPTFIDNSIVSLIAAIILLCVNQGNITSSYKAYYGQSDDIQTYDDGLYGIINFKNLFSTYFIYNFVKGIVMLLAAVLFAILIGILFSNQVQEVMTFIECLIEGFPFNTDHFIESSMFLATLHSLFLIIFPMVIMLGIVYVVYDLIFFPVFLLLNDKVFTGYQALMESKHIMKGHIFQLLTLKLSYFGYSILVGIILVFISLFFGVFSNIQSEILLMMMAIIDAILSSIIYKRKYFLAMIIFYEEVLKEKTEEQKQMEFELLHAPQLQYMNLKSNDEYTVNTDIKEVMDINADNEFYEKMNNKNIFKGLFIYLPLYFVFVSQVVVKIFKLIVQEFKITDINLINAYLNLVVDGIYVILALILFKDVFKDIYQGFKDKIYPHLAKFLLLGYGSVYVSSFVSNLLVVLLNGASNSANQEGIETILNAYPIPILIATIFFAPIVEEIVFRFIIFRSIRNKNVILAHFISAFLFGFIHVSNQVLVAGNWAEMIQIIPYFAMGLVFSLSYERKKTLAAPMALHFVNNLIATIAVLIIS